jgi:hypothetical protein
MCSELAAKLRCALLPSSWQSISEKPTLACCLSYCTSMLRTVMLPMSVPWFLLSNMPRQYSPTAAMNRYRCGSSCSTTPPASSSAAVGNTSRSASKLEGAPFQQTSSYCGSSPGARLSPLSRTAASTASVNALKAAVGR